MIRGPIRLLKRLLRISLLLKIASVLTLFGLALMVWSLAEPTPMPVILAMSVGQGLGIFAFLLFGIAVLLDQARQQRESAAGELKAAEPASNGIPPHAAAPLHGASAGHDRPSASHREAPP